MRVTSTLQTEKDWIGLDAFHDPADARPGFLTTASNVLVRGGKLAVRPGKKGQLSAASGHAAYLGLPYLKADGTTEILLDENGRVYRWPKGATSKTEVAMPGAGSLNSAGARWARLDRYAYRVAPGDPLLRTDLTTGAAVSGLTAPTAPLAAALTSVLLDPFSDASLWTADSLTSAQTNQAVNGDFSGGGTAGPGPPSADYLTQAGWDGHGISVDYYNSPDGHAGVWENGDTPGDYIVSHDPIANFTQSLDAARRATQFFLSYQAFSLDDQNRASFVASVIAYDAGGNEIGRLSRETPILYTGGSDGSQVNTYGAVYSFGDLGVPIASCKVQITNGLQNQLGTNHAPYLTNIVFYPTTPALSLAAGGGGLIVTVPQAVAGVSEMFISGTHLRHTFPAPLDLSRTDQVTLGLGTNAPLLSGLAFRLRLQKSGSADWYDTNPVAVNASAGYASLDLSAGGIPADVRADCAKMEIVFTADVTYSGPGQIVLGPLTGAGNLSVGFADYGYFYTEIDDLGDITLVKFIESNPSPVSNALTPTDRAAEAVLAVPTGPLNPSSTHFRVYRRGGTISDGLARLLASEQWGVSDADGSIAGNRFVSYDHAAHALTDDTPDSFLLGSDDLLDFGHYPPPTGGTAVTAWQNRLWIAVAGRLYASREISSDTDGALYFDRVNLPTDPQLAIEGVTFGVGGADNDPIMAIRPLGANSFFVKGFLVVIKQSGSVWLVSGDNPANFAIQSYLIGQGLGCVAGRAVELVGNKIQWRGVNCIYQFDGDVVDPTNVIIEKLVTNNATPDEAFCYAGRRLFHFAHGPGQGANSRAYVWDSRQNGWTVWEGMNATGAVTLTAGADSDDLYLGGLDGQIYYLGGSGDQSTPGASVVPVTFSVATRAHGQEGGGLDYWQTTQATRLFFSVVAGETVALTAGVSPSAGGYAWTFSYTVGAGQRDVPKTCPCDVRGQALEATLTGSTAQPFTILALALETTEAALAAA